MESYLLVLASLILLIPIIMYLPLGITSKGKMIIILGAILVSIIGVYANTNFPLWQTAGMLLLIIITMTFFMGEKFEGLIFDQEGNDLTAYKSNGPDREIEDKDDLIRLIDNQKQAKELNNQELQQEQPKEIKEVIDDDGTDKEGILMESPETVSLEKDQMIETENEQQAENNEPFAQETINWDEEIELFQNESPILPDDEAEVMGEVDVEHQAYSPEPSHLMEGEEDKLFFKSNEVEPYGSLTNDEVAFLLNKDELIPPEESSVHFMEDIEILLEDDDEDLVESKELTVEEPTVDPIINVYAEGDSTLFIDELEEENPIQDNVARNDSDMYMQSDFVNLENEDLINTEETTSEEVFEVDEWLNSDQQAANHLSDLPEELLVNETEEVLPKEDKKTLSSEPPQQETQKPNQSSTEHSVLQTQLFDTFFNQIKLAKMTCTEDEYVALIKGYLTAELPDQTYYQFSILLLDHFIEKKKWGEMKQHLLELQIRFKQYPILAEQMDYLYQTYCA